MLSQSNGREVNLGPTPEVIKLDATCAIKVCARGSKSVAHMRKSRAIEAAAFLARYWAAKNGVVKASRRVVHERGTELSVDIGTKSVGSQRLDMMRPKLGVIHKDRIPDVPTTELARRLFWGFPRNLNVPSSPTPGCPTGAYQLVGGVRHAASCILVSMQPSCILLSPQTTHTPPTARVLGTDSQTDSSWC